LARRLFFVDRIDGGSAELAGEDARHLTRVLRVEPGQRFEISDNRAAWLAEVAEARGERVVFRVIEPIESPAAPVRITLLAAIVKFDRFEWIVAARKRAERWRRIARESSQQSRRVSVPEILPAAAFEVGIGETANFRYFLEESQAPPFLTLLPERRAATDHVAVMLGPEGGWTDMERRMAAGAGWLAVSLGPLVLRAETAAAAALAVIGAAWLAANATTMKD
jgi:16S rRNA (uracil1498-N3)-methyltransferase